MHLHENLVVFCRWKRFITCYRYWHRDDSRFAPNQWEMALQSNAVSHWLGANLESVLLTYGVVINPTEGVCLSVKDCCCISRMNLNINSLLPGDVIPHWRSWSSVVQAMAYWLTAPSHYQNQHGLIISKTLWHSSEGIIIMHQSVKQFGELHS